MKTKLKKLFIQQKKRYLKKIVGTMERPRLAVYRSHKHIYAQLIDDKSSQTLAFSSTLDKELSSKIENTATQEAGLLVGQQLAQKALKKQISKHKINLPIPAIVLHYMRLLTIFTFSILPLLILRNSLPGNNLVKLIIVMFVSSLIYWCLGFLFKIKEIKSAIRILTSAIK
jgi:large subunit ribosomal protein L18